MDAATVFLHLALPLRYGFFSDVHGDLEGLERALEALSEVDRLVFLGDVLGGRRDRECLERLQSISELIWVPGNHDLWEFESMGLSPTAQTALRCLPLEQPVEELSRYVDGLITWARKAHEASDPAEKLAAKRQVCSRWLNCVISESVASVWAVPWPVLPGEE